jgi:hypothetical protein
MNMLLAYTARVVTFVRIISTTIQLEPKTEKSQHFSKIDYYGQLWMQNLAIRTRSCVSIIISTEILLSEPGPPCFTTCASAMCFPFIIFKALFLYNDLKYQIKQKQQNIRLFSLVDLKTIFIFRYVLLAFRTNWSACNQETLDVLHPRKNCCKVIRIKDIDSMTCWYNRHQS